MIFLYTEPYLPEAGNLGEKQVYALNYAYDFLHSVQKYWQYISDLYDEISFVISNVLHYC
jgi:hypothetical protein